jgi:hypothetical protein
MGLPEIKKRARQKLEGHGVDIENKELLHQYQLDKKKGYHCVSEFLMSEESYSVLLAAFDFSRNLTILNSLKSSGAFESLAKLMSY